MFYDHRILTQRKYGVATVWLVATIGPKNTLSKKVHKKEILEVNVTKACRTILQSENPLALRLQSNLLFGVSRVFSEQYNYLFADVTNAHQKISKDFFIQPDTGQIDLAGVRIRPETLLLQDDPAFIPELSFVLPELLPLPDDPLHHTTQLTTEDKTLLPSEHSLPPSIRGAECSALDRLIIPDSSSIDGGGFRLRPFFGDDFHVENIDHEDLDENVDFMFDEYGEIQDITNRVSYPLLEDPDLNIEGLPHEKHEGPAETQKRNRWLSPVGSERVRREHEDGQKNPDMDDNLMDLDEFQGVFPARNATEYQPAEPFPLRQQEHQGGQIVVLVSHRREKKPRLARADDTLELRTSDLAALGSNYLNNMNQARRKRYLLQNIHTVKKIAREWVYSWGGMLRVGSLQTTFDGNNILSLLNPNAYDELLTGFRSMKSCKRSRPLNAGEEDESKSEGSQEGRRIRSERAGDQIARGLPTEIEEIDLQNFGSEDQDPGVARQGSLNLEGNAMPWNIPEWGSRAGSVVSFGGFRTSSVGRIPSSANRHPSSAGHRKVSPAVGASRAFGKRAGRITPSPIVRQTRVLISDSAAVEEHGDLGDMESEDGYFAGGESLVGHDLHDGVLPGKGRDEDSPVSLLDTQNSRWLEETLERESFNFFEYLRSQLLYKYEAGQNIGTKGYFLTFEELISPTESSRIVAAHGFHHLLYLATRGSIRVTQDHYLEPIIISTVAG